jgi:hypothetical protein
MERMLKRPDQLVDQARNCLELRDWKGCLKACQMALFCEPSGDLFAAALYLKAISLFELGRIEEALLELGKVEGLATLYPKYAAHAMRLKFDIASEAKSLKTGNS